MKYIQLEQPEEMNYASQTIDLRPFNDNKIPVQKVTGTVLIAVAIVLLVVSTIPYISLAFEGFGIEDQAQLENPQENRILRGARSVPHGEVLGAEDGLFTNAQLPDIGQLPTSLASSLTLAEAETTYAAPQTPLGHLYINGADVQVNAPVSEGVEAANFLNGVGHQPGTALPGQRGNLVIAGHRWLPKKESPYARIFQDLPDLKIGETVELVTPNGEHTYTYEVYDTQIIDPTDVHILDQTEEPELTIYTCHPMTSTRYRYVVHTRLIDVS